MSFVVLERGCGDGSFVREIENGVGLGHVLAHTLFR